MTFYDTLLNYDWEEVGALIASKTEEHVRQALEQQRPTMDQFAALISPAAEALLPQMAQRSYETTRRRFGNTLQLYLPLYLSNRCQNHCLYCGFKADNPLRRTLLTSEQIHAEARAIKRDPFQHILLVTGEAPQGAGVEYIARAMAIMQQYFEQISLEVQPLSTQEYVRLRECGLHGVYVYQETYHRERYGVYHPAGPKSDFRWRLETPDRLSQAGVHKVGLGNLIGLEAWRTEAFFTALHLRYLESRYWRTKYSIAFPRLRPYQGEEGFNPGFPASERNLTQLICAYRLLSEDVELSLSTRESPQYRDKVMPFGVTTMSAGSKTTPGGYTASSGELEQWEINDDRTPTQVAEAIRAKGFDPVWRDWWLPLQTPR